MTSYPSAVRAVRLEASEEGVLPINLNRLRVY